MAVESEEVHHESSKEYDSEEYEDDEEVLDTEHIDVEMEEDDFKTQGKERCKDAFLNFSSDYEDNEVDEDNDLVDEDEEGFGSEEEIDDTAGANDLDLGDAVGAGFPIHDPSVKWNKMKPLLGERYESPHQLQQCLTNYAIKSGYNIKFAKCDTELECESSGPSIFEARNGLEGYVVDLQSKVCSCRLWDISGIPCVHAQCAILFTGQDPVQFISSRGGARGSRGGTGGKRGGAVGNTGGARGGAVGNRGGKIGGRGSKRGGRGSKTSVGIEGGGVAEVEGYSIEEIKNTLSLTDSHMKQLNDYNDTIEQVLPMSMEEEYPPQTETQDGAEEIIPETQPESEEEEEEEEEEESINDTQELPVHLRIVKRRRPSKRIVKTKLKKMGCVGTSANSALELD
ncbi:unnamed protein product [Lactuca virosa]|uniref:SWIM-type domain-containing protein n=1 Tax=Lactuca virosa TaxID=75947 RepID=A0AAU9M3K2_9ASTR|nr:unnamed protein product [Lactuca virosa]